MPTWNDLYGDVYDIDAEDLPEDFLGDGPEYPDRILKSGQVIDGNLISPSKQDKQQKTLESSLKNEQSKKENIEIKEESAMPRTSPKQNNRAFPVSQTRSTKTQNKLVFGSGAPKKRSNEI